ncbi:unnamed protein product, partial [Laminaria digitata]
GRERDQPPTHDRRRRLSGLSRDFDHLCNRARKKGLIRLRAGEKRYGWKFAEGIISFFFLLARWNLNRRWKLRPPSPRSSPSRRRRTAATIVSRRTSL